MKPKKPEDVPLFAVYRNGRRVYLPPTEKPGVPLEEAERIAAFWTDATAVQVYEPEPTDD